MEKNKDDLQLKDLSQYYGSEHHYKLPLFRSKITDGVLYVFDNGYGWVVTDCLSILEHHPKVKDEPFKTIKLKVDKETRKAIIEYSDGNNNILYTQKYYPTNAEQNITFFHCDDVLMLDREY